MSRRVPWWVLALLFVVVPVVEIYVLIQVGQVIGAWWTVLLLIADGVLGGWLVRREGGRAWKALREALESGRMPARELADGGLILVGGTLLLTPGFVSRHLRAVLRAAVHPAGRPAAADRLPRPAGSSPALGDVRRGRASARDRHPDATTPRTR